MMMPTVTNQELLVVGDCARATVLFSEEVAVSVFKGFTQCVFNFQEHFVYVMRCR